MFLFFQQHTMPWGASLYRLLLLYGVLKGKRPNDFKSFDLKNAVFLKNREYLENTDVWSKGIASASAAVRGVVQTAPHTGQYVPVCYRPLAYYQTRYY